MKKTMRNIRATSDIVFKYLFGAKSSTELLRAFVNAVQRHAGMEEFTKLEIVNPIGEREYLNAKLTIIDVKAKASDGRIVNLEVQVRSQVEYRERSLYYWAKAYNEQIDENEQYSQLRPVISVSLLDFRLFPDEIPFRSTFTLREQNRPDYCLTQDCIMHYLELPKLPANDDSELAQWMYALKHLHELRDEEDNPMHILLEDNHNLMDLAKRYKRFEADEGARHAYHAREMFLHDQASILEHETNDARERGKEQGLAEGLAEGLEKGLAEGLSKGVAAGEAQGKAAGLAAGKAEGQHAARREIARSMKSTGMPNADISRLTGLPEAQVEKL